MDNESISSIINTYTDNKHLFEHFMKSVQNFFELNPRLNKKPLPIIHSIKSRLKEVSHLEEKISRKIGEGRNITLDNFFQEITDIAGVRVLHLYQDQFIDIHNVIMNQVDIGEWLLAEPPKAYTWDPEYKKIYESLQIKTELKDTFYTSTHYLVKPNNKQNNIVCEIQVRTLFEEIWGEIDHTINYPKKTNSIACGEQLRVLAKLVSTGTRLADSIFRSHAEHKKNS